MLWEFQFLIKTTTAKHKKNWNEINLNLWNATVDSIYVGKWVNALNEFTNRKRTLLECPTIEFKMKELLNVLNEYENLITWGALRDSQLCLLLKLC